MKLHEFPNAFRDLISIVSADIQQDFDEALSVFSKISIILSDIGE